ncbi:phosphoinositide-3-kinase-interacting protein 1-like [Chanos chanos]|uniref:Phosphoinositide-3-kinase-interacting protein 1-like n=1 Tax=Chanos chanos TaxID=29144 RepID=A0A6J2WA71_CHACN|nr:phosphoinositide-3-kinase-interacting protein 1-like [Chanos chanos]
MHDCSQTNGTQYYGKQMTSSTGERCLNWLNLHRDHNLTTDLGSDAGLWDHNYCRSLDGSVRPWCYVDAGGGDIERQDCGIDPCQDQVPFPGTVTEGWSRDTQTEPVDTLPVQGETVAVKPDSGISRHVHVRPKKKKDLGALGYVLGILLMAIIVFLGSGITVGYFYKRGLKLRQQQEQRAYEQEMQRMQLPMSAFSNPACDLSDECTPDVADRDTPPGTGGEPKQEGADTGDGSDAPKKEADSSGA